MRPYNDADRRRALLLPELIRQHQERHGCSPSRRELQAAFGDVSPDAVQRAVACALSVGIVEQTPGMMRSLRVPRVQRAG